MPARLSSIGIYIRDAEVACFRSFAYDVMVYVDVFRPVVDTGILC